MAKSAGDVLTSARYTLNDAAKRRLPDAEGLTYVVDALNAIKNQRPDLFIGGGWTAIESLTLGATLPIDAQFFRPVVDYVIARAESKDAAHVLNARVKLMADLAGGFLS
jgi:hypothetical protein